MSFVKHLLEHSGSQLSSNIGLPFGPIIGAGNQLQSLGPALAYVPRKVINNGFPGSNATEAQVAQQDMQSGAPAVDREKPQLRTNTITGEQFTIGTPGAKPLSEQNIPGHAPNNHLHASLDQAHNIVMHLNNKDYEAVNSKTTAEDVANTAAEQVLKGVKDSGVNISDGAAKKFMSTVVEDSKQWYADQIHHGRHPQTTDYYIYLTQRLNGQQIVEDGGQLPVQQPDYIQSAQQQNIAAVKTTKSAQDAVKTIVPADDPVFQGNPILYKSYTLWAAGELQKNQKADVSFDSFKRTYPGVA